MQGLMLEKNSLGHELRVTQESSYGNINYNKLYGTYTLLS